MYTGGQITHRQSPKVPNVQCHSKASVDLVLLARMINHPETVSSLMFLDEVVQDFLCCAVVSLATLALELSSVPPVAHFCEKSLKLFAYSEYAWLTGYPQPSPHNWL